MDLNVNSGQCMAKSPNSTGW